MTGALWHWWWADWQFQKWPRCIAALRAPWKVGGMIVDKCFLRCGWRLVIYKTSIGLRKEERGRNKVSLSAKVAVLKFLASTFWQGRWQGGTKRRWGIRFWISICFRKCWRQLWRKILQTYVVIIQRRPEGNPDEQESSFFAWRWKNYNKEKSRWGIFSRK